MFCAHAIEDVMHKNAAYSHEICTILNAWYVVLIWRLFSVARQQRRLSWGQFS